MRKRWITLAILVLGITAVWFSVAMPVQSPHWAYTIGVIYGSIAATLGWLWE